MVSRTWYDVLLWAAEQLEREGKRVLRKPFSTLDLAEVLDGDGRAYAHSVTQKLWKWGYLRKAVGDRGRKAAEASVEQAYADRAGRSKPTHGGAGRKQGRYPVIWFVTNKGIWRASQSRELAGKVRRGHRRGADGGVR